MIIPAIDLQNGEAVRLYKGDYAQKTVYSKNPAELAKEFEKMGAKYLHVVDLDGAKSGLTPNVEVIRKIRENVGIPIQVGGGIRNAETVSLYLDELKITRVILGTIAVKNPEFARDMIEKFGAERIVVGVDVKNGRVLTSGWTEDCGVDYLDFIERLKRMGVKYIVATDISKDGTLTSPNWEMYEKIKGVNVIVSGGVSCEGDIGKARDYYGVIVGKAFYEKKVDLAKIFNKLNKRIIPCLDIMNGKVVKGVNFTGIAGVGDPAEIARRYEEQGADEIVLLDITATYEERETIFPLIERLAGELSIPVTVGGGIRTVDDMRRIFASGADKAGVNSALVANPELLREASEEFGKQRVVAAIDGKKVGENFHVFVRGGRDDTGLDLVGWAKKCEERGACEILLTSIDGDGTKNGYDIPMTKAVVDSTNIPVIASGGCGRITDVIDVFRETGCDAALCASLFHYGMATVNDVKLEMERRGIPCRRSRD
ncbi:MAG: 1-(5-phosphoribosyl)-5-[(5-phosphoribosylamino)methylideneamino]imidazole-4-carboxamide isomerase [Synergistaceae bacterium]|nr:1-(5-phosphoribosyl)-5-[(5-phosphoribosylamino)methylideneamino]imidazole-4-carboxamide isomerase [Synergistaceae bacterium]